MIEKLSASAMILTATGTAVGTSVAGTSPYAWVAPVACGCFAALIVRAITIATPSKRKRAWVFEVLVSVLCVFVTGVLVYDRALGIAAASLIGITFGGMGVGIISWGRSIGLEMVTNIAKSIVARSALAPENDSTKKGD